MPPQEFAWTDEEEDIKPLRSLTVRTRRPIESDSEFDELESDADDPLVPPPPYYTRGTTRTQRPGTASDGLRAQNSNERKREKKQKAKEEKRKRRKAEKQATLAAASQNRDRLVASRDKKACAADGPSSTKQIDRNAQQSQVSLLTDISDDDDPRLPSLGIQAPTQQLSAHSRSPLLRSMSEDEVELVASQSAEGPSAAAVDPSRSSSMPVQVDPSQHQAPSHRAASANPEDTAGFVGMSASAHEDTSDTAFQRDLAARTDDVSSSDVSSVEVSDSEDYDSNEEFYTSSEGSLHGSDSEEGLGHWNEYDQQHWQGSTVHLDDAYGDSFDVRAVLRHRKNPRRGFLQYRTVWAGYPPYSSTWEQEKNFDQKKTLRDYWKRQGGRPDDAVEDPFSHSAHSSDTDVAVNRRPRQRAHEAKKKKRLDIRRDRVQLRQLLQSFDETRRAAKAREEAKYEEMRLRKQISLDTKRLHAKGTSRGHQKRQERIAQKKWQRSASSGGSNVAGPSRLNATRTDRNLIDISMKARTSASGTMAARTRVSQLNDSIPYEDDENQITFRRSAPNYSGPSTSMAPTRRREDLQYGTARPAAALSMSSIAGPSSESTSQAAAARPVPGSYKGAHRREPKIQLKQDFGSFLNRLHSGAGGASGASGARAGATNAHAPQPLPIPSDGSSQPIATARRPSEARKPNLLVLKPVEDFQGGSRPVPLGPQAHADSSTSSEAGDVDAFGIPEMSAVRSQFNPRQHVLEGDESTARDRQTSSSSVTKCTGPKQVSFAQAGSAVPRNLVPDPRRRPVTGAGDILDGSEPSWSPHREDGQWSPQDPGFFAVDTVSKGGRSSVPPSPPNRSPLEGDTNDRAHDSHLARMPRRLVWNGWIEFDVGHNKIETEGALFATETLSADRMQALGLASPGGTVCFNMFMPFAWIRDVLAGPSVNFDEVMLLHAHGFGAPQARYSVDQVSEQLKTLDVALLAYASDEATTGRLLGPRDYFVAFSSKYAVNYITGVPPSLSDVSGQNYVICVVSLKLELQPAPSAQISFEKIPRLEPTVSNVFEDAVGKKTIQDLNIGRREVSKVKLAAERYRISTELYKGIRSKYNVIFLGTNPQTYEKSILYLMVRIFEGGARLGLDLERDAKLWKDPKIGTNVFVRRAAFEEMLSSDPTRGETAPSLAPFLRRFKRQPRCTFFTFGFAPTAPDERVREIFPGRSGLVTFSLSAILTDLLHCSMAAAEADFQEKRREADAGQPYAARFDPLRCGIPSRR